MLWLATERYCEMREIILTQKEKKLKKMIKIMLVLELLKCQYQDQKWSATKILIGKRAI